MTVAVTLKEVADASGVSLATASRAFRAPNLLAEHTRRQVLGVATRLGYVAPDRRGRRLALVVPDATNPVYARTGAAVIERAWTNRHQLVLSGTDEDPDRELETLRSVSRDVDGLILCSPRTDPRDALAAVGDTPLVVINGHAATADTPIVLLDLEQGLTQAVEHLHATGHERLVYVPGPRTSWANAARVRTLRGLATRYGMTLVLVGNQAATVQGGLVSAAEVVTSRATAAIAYNDLVALGLQAGMRRLGRSVPDDLSLVGIDDMDFAALLPAGLTTIRTEAARSGAVALDLLLALINGERPAQAGPYRLSSHLIVRGTTAPVNPSAASGRGRVSRLHVAHQPEGGPSMDLAPPFDAGPPGSTPPREWGEPHVTIGR